ncbi:hypothetical protein L6164_007284 [Bauhinia variegata]|uniref:Uncharacterized protein n=1 Tax=Bauhinia variegata TaxID=167791 RepID=A0ACB9PDE7_BAUVA|nr:hypothetical protein L6164_007284 [Bauhinia variegata]
MDSSSTNVSNHGKLVRKQCDIFCPSGTGKYPSSRRTPSFSSSCSSLSPSSSSLESLFLADDPLGSPASSFRFSGVPFSWEHLPGIPKKQNSKKIQESSLKLQPLLPPPSTTANSSKRLNLEETRIRKKNSIANSLQRDPFFAAFVECSKDNEEQEETSGNFWNGAKVSRSISDRFGFISLYASCKRTCAVSESIIYLPTSRRSTYQHLNRPSL